MLLKTRTAKTDQLEQRLARLEEAVDKLARQVSKLAQQMGNGNKRKAKKHPLIECKPGVRGGDPVLKGTRICVFNVIEMVRLGRSVKEMLEAWPHVTPQQIHAALEYYLDHRDEIDRQIEVNNDDQFWKAYVECTRLASTSMKTRTSK